MCCYVSIVDCLQFPNPWRHRETRCATERLVGLMFAWPSLFQGVQGFRNFTHNYSLCSKCMVPDICDAFKPMCVPNIKVEQVQHSQIFELELKCYTYRKQGFQTFRISTNDDIQYFCTFAKFRKPMILLFSAFDTFHTCTLCRTSISSRIWLTQHILHIPHTSV